jgi:hypothetical protein
VRHTGLASSWSAVALWIAFQAVCGSRLGPPALYASPRGALPTLAASAAPTINSASNLVASGVSATMPRVVSLALGMSHSCALINTGEVRCWGQFAGKARHDGQMENLGDNETPATRLVPRVVR